MPLSDEELERYARHILLRDVGGPGQQKLKGAKVLVIGAGGLGSPVILYLAATGVGTIAVVDDDEVALSNLQRQVLHTTARIGTPKVDSAKAMVADINPNVEVVPLNTRITEENAAELIANCATNKCAGDACADASHFALLLRRCCASCKHARRGEQSNKYRRFHCLFLFVSTGL